MPTLLAPLAPLRSNGAEERYSLEGERVTWKHDVEAKHRCCVLEGVWSSANLQHQQCETSGSEGSLHSSPALDAGLYQAYQCV